MGVRITQQTLEGSPRYRPKNGTIVANSYLDAVEKPVAARSRPFDSGLSTREKRDAFASSFWRASVSWRANTPSLLKSRSPLDSKDCPGPRTMSCSAILSVAGFSLHARGSRWGRSMNWAILAQSSAWLPIDAQRSSHRIALPS